jgi:hypothetical protein
MNYGWGGPANAWFAIDDLYCTWTGCDYMNESAIINIAPNWVWPEADITFESVPMEVQFTTETGFTVDNWRWDFGDGQTAEGQLPSVAHLYETPGTFDITVEIDVGPETYTVNRSSYIIAIADTLKAGLADGPMGGTVRVPIYAVNNIPIDEFTIPLRYSGDIALVYDSCSTAGCRTENIFIQESILGSGLLLFKLIGGGVHVNPGDSEILNVYFTVLSGSSNDATVISLENIGENYAYFESTQSGFAYNPAIKEGLVTLPMECGDVNRDMNINILDIVFMINFLYKSGPAPVPAEKANVNNDGAVNILDIVYLINHLYKEGPGPSCPTTD